MRVGAAGVAAGLAGGAPGAADEGPRVMTVRGPIAPEAMGPTLPHEHILVDFVGAKAASPDRYDAAEVARVALPYLRQIHEQGIRTLVDCTPAYLGRDPALLRRLSEASGLHVLTPAGYYGAGKGKFLPEHAHAETAEALAARWLDEWRGGIAGTGIRPGFLKLGADAGPLPEVHRKLLRAAARAHLASGLTIAMHSGDGAAALEALDLLRDEGVGASAFVWVHAQNERDPRRHVAAAARGAWVEFDGIGPDSLDRHVELVRAMRDAGHLDRVLLSHDAGWYHVGEPGGGAFRPFDTLMAAFLPALRREGWTEAEVGRLVAAHPQAAFAVRPRPA
jgi:phosphotriesterase-related protein